MAGTPPPTRNAKAERHAEPEGDIRLGGWLMVLVGVVLLLAALLLLVF